MTDRPDDSHLPLIQRIPPTSVASPSDLRPRDPNDIRWYKPGLEETLKLMGWRWMYFLPAVGVLAGLFFLPRFLLFSQAIGLIWKLLVIVVGVPAGIFINTARHSIRMRKEPFCI